MQTIRIYRKSGGIAAQFTGITGKTETKEMQQQFPEGQYLWLR